MFKVSARTILELGSELISSDIIAFYELIKNGFDAGSENGVEIEFDIVIHKNTCRSIRRRMEASDNQSDIAPWCEAIDSALDLSASKLKLDNAKAILDEITEFAELVH